jgi:hypothetical protein
MLIEAMIGFLASRSCISIRYSTRRTCEYGERGAANHNSTQQHPPADANTIFKTAVYWQQNITISTRDRDLRWTMGRFEAIAKPRCDVETAPASI